MRGRCVLLVLLAAAPAQAHVGERALVLLMPTDMYIAAGVAAVAASFAVLTLVPGGALLAAFRPRRLWRGCRATPGTGWSMAAFAGFALLVAIGFLGPRDPLANLAPLTIWSLWWGVFPAAQAVFGDLWACCNPFSGPYRLLRRVLGLTGTAPMRLPEWLGYWPASLWFLAFAWVELVYIAPQDPARLARAMALYWGVTLAGMMVFGEAAWLGRAECFSVFFRLLAGLAPIRRHQGVGGAVCIAPPGAHGLAHAALPVSGALFVLLTLASVSFDGLKGTFWWLGMIGVNPLEFSGRSAVIGANSAGLVAMWAMLSLAFLLAVTAGHRLAGARGSLRESLGRQALAIMPIALGYHVAHYLTIVMVDAQYWLAALADMTGIGHAHVTTSFLNHADSVARIWFTQAGATVLGHIVAVLLAHVTALRLHVDPRAAVRAQIPLAGLMIGYTLFGLWLLATPTGA